MNAFLEFILKLLDWYELLSMTAFTWLLNRIAEVAA